MIGEILSILFHKKTADKHTVDDAPKKPDYPLGGGYYLEFREVNNGEGGYCRTNMYLRKTGDPAFSRCIIDERGRIQNFAGFKDGDWKKSLEYPLDNEVRFAFWVSVFEDGKARVEWTLQPDGRYFEDEDGFGAEHFSEITLFQKMLSHSNSFLKQFSLRKILR